MSDSTLVSNLYKKANSLRNLTLDTCSRAGTGHVTSSFSSAEILACMYHGGILKYDSKNPQWALRDRFVLSRGQASPIFYATLADAGFFPKDWLETFCQKDGKFGVHLQDTVPGVEISSGSLGHGLGIGAGMAYADKLNRLRDHYFTFVFMGDGECQEGSVWESAMLASTLKLNNLVAIIDRNGLCATDFTESSAALNPFADKWKAFGWNVKSINGHSVEHILDAFSEFRAEKSNAPYVVIADTIKGYGSPQIESQIRWHAMTPKGNDLETVRKEINEERWGYRPNG